MIYPFLIYCVIVNPQPKLLVLLQIHQDTFGISIVEKNSKEGWCYVSDQCLHIYFFSRHYVPKFTQSYNNVYFLSAD
jgi:hypothetical protein